MSSDKELEEQLIEAGNRIVDPPSSVEELLPLLDQIENFLLKVEQSPAKSLQNALSPALKALVSDKLMNHPDVDVKVAVASCISEITRITAPDAPYNDDQMKEIFQLIVSSFENLPDKSSRSYIKRTSILETVAKVRSCVVMLDLECDALILEMFQHFLKSIRDYHPENVFTSMETIMTLVLEESEDISPELIALLLANVKKDNEEVVPIARKLGERVLESCSAELKPSLMQAVKSIGISLDEYSKVVVSICQETSGGHNDVREQTADDSKLLRASPHEDPQEDKNMGTEEPSPEQVDSLVDKSPKLVMGNGVTQAGETDTSLDVSVAKKEEVGEVHHTNQPENNTSGDDELQRLDAEKVASTECMPGESAKKRGRKPKVVKLREPIDAVGKEASEKLLANHESDKDLPDMPHLTAGAGVHSETVNTGIHLSLPKALESKSMSIASQSPIMNLPNENRPRKPGRPKKKQNITKDETPAANDAANKTNEDANNLEDKSKKRPGKKAAFGVSNEDITPIKEVTLPIDDVVKKSNEGKNNLGIKPNKRSGKKVVSGVSKEDKSPTTVDAPPSDLEEKPFKSVKKMDLSSDGEGSHFKQTTDKKRKGRGKASLDKNVKSSLTKDDDEEMIPSPKSVPKSTKVEHLSEETPKINHRRKSSLAIDKTSNTKDFGENLVGSKIKVWWPKDKMFYKGVVDSFDSVKKKHKVLYVDGDEEILNLKREKWEVVGDDSKTYEEEVADGLSPEDSPEMPEYKKTRVNPDPSIKKAEIDASPKSNTKTATATSGRRSKVGRSDGTFKYDVPKTAYGSDDGSDKSEHDTPPEGGSKSVDIASKVSRMSKLKNVDTSASKNSAKPKQDTPKTLTKSKGITPKAGGKSKPNGTGKMKSSQSKAKDSEDVEANSTDSTTALETVKGSEGKPGKKRQRVAKS